jgi:hypothetical protein
MKGEKIGYVRGRRCVRSMWMMPFERARARREVRAVAWEKFERNRVNAWRPRGGRGHMKKAQQHKRVAQDAITFRVECL